MQVRKQAVDIVLGLTGSPEGLQQLTARSGQLLPVLFRMASDAEDVGRPALTSLVNLSQVS